MTTLVCIGVGYCARFYVAEFGPRFARVIGTSRSLFTRVIRPSHSPDKVEAGAGEVLLFDGIRALRELRDAIASATHLLISAAPGEAGDPVLAALAGDIARAPKLQSIVYLSSLGVY